MGILNNNENETLQTHETFSIRTLGCNSSYIQTFQNKFSPSIYFEIIFV